MKSNDEIIMKTYDLSKEYMKNFHPIELEIFDDVWDSMEIRTFDDLKGMCESEFLSSSQSDELSFEATSSALFSEIIIAISANLIYSYVVDGSIKKTKEKLYKMGVNKKIINKLHDLINNSNP